MKTSKLVAALLIAMSATAMSAAKAETITYNFSNAGLYNGVNLNYSGVFATASFTDNGLNTVLLTMTVNSGLNGAYVNDWAFNVKSDSFTSALIPTFVSGTPVGTNEAAAKVYINDNHTKNFGGANGGDFYIEFDFSTQDPGQITSPGSVTYQLTANGLSASDFNAQNDKNRYSAVHVQGSGISQSSYYSSTDGSGGGTGVPVPEPTTVATLGLGLLGLAFARRRKSK